MWLLERRGRVLTAAATSDVVRRLDALQQQLAEGPCHDATHREAVVVAPRIRHDQRWPCYVPRAVAMEPPAPSTVLGSQARSGLARRASSRSRAPSQLTARDRDDASVVSRRSRAYWDDDSASLAPDDSISNVGSRR